MRRPLLTLLATTLLSSAAVAEEPPESTASTPEVPASIDAEAAEDREQPLESDVDAPEDELTAGAEEAFAAGDYDGAIRLLERAYNLTGNPNMLYNIARVHEERGDVEAALDNYRRFVVSPDVDLDYRREALETSDLLERQLAKKDPELSPVDISPAVDSDHQPSAQANGELLRPAPFPSTSSMRPLGFTLAGIGGAALLTGGALGLAALSSQKSFEEAGSLAQRREAAERTRDLATAADALYISGAVLMVTGLITAFASPERERSFASGFGMTVTPQGMGAAWSLQF